ncbi:MAG TPA: GSU2403 family nucleotidyltransferase fold protein, partial [Methylomirabilota bacterium]|nr:GSU2403 family nucleotidyltransferase fold protein [Methylomirabilota bacterium]
PSKRAPYRSIAVPELGAHATALPFLDYVLEDSVISILIGRDRIVPVAVPHAGRFCIHKLVVQSLRGAADIPKREKDAFQSVLLAAVLAQEQEFLLREAIEAMTKQLRSRARPGVKRALKILQADHPDAAEIIQQLA